MKTGSIVGLVLAIVIIAVVAACRGYQPEQPENAARSKNSGGVGQGNQAGLIRVIRDETVGHKEDPTFRTKDCDYIFDMRDNGWMTIEVEIYGNRIFLGVSEMGEGTYVVDTATQEQTSDNVPIEKEVCAETVDFCDTVDAWCRVLINDHEVVIHREEIRLVTFDNGLRIRMTNLDNDPELCVNRAGE